MLAIIIPYYKYTFFEETLQSLANQTVKRFKVYIGDDASPEDPLELLEKYKGQFEFEYIKFETNIGGVSLVKQWERCIAMTEDKEWIMILGDDDVLSSNVVENWYKNFELFNGKSNLIRFSTQVIDSDSISISEVYKHPILENSGDSYFKRFKGLTRSSLSEYIFLKDVYNKYVFKNYPLAWHSDDYAWLDFTENKPIYSINESTVLIRISSVSITGNYENVESKITANTQFLKDCITYKLKKFSKTQRLELMMAFEINVKKHRLLYKKELFLLLFLYCKNFKFYPFLKYNRRFLIYFFKL